MSTKQQRVMEPSGAETILKPFNAANIDACPKCGYDDSDLRYVAGPPEHLLVTCNGCGYAFRMHCKCRKNAR